jgi:phytoene dehydrogenase-like protein
VSGRVIVVGGGHNGLVAAAWLAKHGREVVLLEARDQLGGVAARETFGDGFAVPGLLHDSAGFRGWIADALGLAAHGLRRRATPLTVLAAEREAAPLALTGDRLEGADGDAERYGELRGFIGRVARVVRRLTDEPAIDPLGGLWPLLTTGLAVRRLGARDLVELLRVAPMCVADWMRDSFASEAVRAFVAAPALEGAFTGPWSAGTAANLLLREATAEAEVEGGPAAVTAALEAAARAFGVTLRTGARVGGIRLGPDGVAGVTLADGESLDAALVVSTCDPKRTLLGLVGSQHLTARLAGAVRAIRTRGTTAKVHLALSAPLETADGRKVEALRTGGTLDALEKAFDAAKYRRFAERPALDVRVPTEQDPSLAPPGHHVVSILAHAAAYDLEGGWTDATREALGDAVVATLAEACPGVSAASVAREVLTPADLEARYGLTGGHVHHGEHAPDQLMFMRPTIDCARYATPIPGLYLGGSGAHPGGGITGVPGALAAKAVLGR